jgi:outer membrane protein assembly factor BamB
METPSVPRRRRVRWGIALGIVVLVAAALYWVQSQEDLTIGFRFMYSFLAVAVGYLLLLLWTLFFSGLRWWMSLPLVVLGLAAPIALMKMVRIEESIDGSGRPRFEWVWAPPSTPKDEGLSTPKSKTETVDLKTTTPDDYPRFLGAAGQPIVHNVRPAQDWSAQPPKKLWHQRIGVGWSSFAVVGPYAVTQEQIGDQELIVCYEVATGKARWTHANPEVRWKDKQGGDGPRSTPTVVDGRVYAMGATGILDCLDGATGEPIWSKRVLDDNDVHNIIWGKSCSPLVVGDLVLVTGGKEGPSLLAFNKDTGKEVWREGQDESSYSSPVLARNLAGRDQVLVITATRLTAHNLKDGHVLWEFPKPGGMAVCAQPIPLSGDRVVMPGGAGGGCALLQVKAETDGSMSVSEVWRTVKMKPGFATMVVRGDYLYGLDDNTLACIDLKTGKRKWRDGTYGWGQVLLAEDTLIVQADTGEVVLVEATPEKFHELGRCPMIEGKTWNNPALSGRRLLVRNDQWAACYELPLR